MNHLLIRKFAVEADIWCDQNFPNATDYAIKWEEKFAQLIVNHCAEVCDSVAEQAAITNTGEMARKTKATAQNCSKMISLTFGNVK